MLIISNYRISVDIAPIFTFKKIGIFSLVRWNINFYR